MDNHKENTYKRYTKEKEKGIKAYQYKKPNKHKYSKKGKGQKNWTQKG